MAGAALLVIVGQALNVSVFYRLGSEGVFYGRRFGRPVSWIRAFPFSWTDHPQYVGTVLTIWGVFLFMRFPNPDWIVLPALETVYYALGARFER
jgi:methylene-fatty-acyl-phospholipid synthase